MNFVVCEMKTKIFVSRYVMTDFYSFKFSPVSVLLDPKIYDLESKGKRNIPDAN